MLPVTNDSLAIVMWKDVIGRLGIYRCPHQRPSRCFYRDKYSQDRLEKYRYPPPVTRRMFYCKTFAEHPSNLSLSSTNDSENMFKMDKYQQRLVRYLMNERIFEGKPSNLLLSATIDSPNFCKCIIGGMDF